MLERILRHPAGRFARCRKCGAEPRHVHSLGYSSLDPIELSRRPQSSSRHALECRCGVRTARYPSLTRAEAQWRTDFGQLALTADSYSTAARIRTAADLAAAIASDSNVLALHPHQRRAHA